MTVSFADLGLSPKLVAALPAAGFTTPTPIQAQAIPYVLMGRDLGQNEYVMAINFDHQNNIYENLSAILETGWAHGQFSKEIWGRRLVNQARNGDSWKVAFGLQYRF